MSIAAASSDGKAFHGEGLGFAKNANHSGI